MAITAKAPTPQARKSSDSYMFEAGIRPATCQRIPMPQLMTAKPGDERGPRRDVEPAALEVPGGDRRAAARGGARTRRGGWAGPVVEDLDARPLGREAPGGGAGVEHRAEVGDGVQVLGGRPRVAGLRPGHDAQGVAVEESSASRGAAPRPSAPPSRAGASGRSCCSAARRGVASAG